MYTAPTSLPVALSYARSMRPLLAGRVGEETGLAGNHQGFRCQHADNSRAARARNCQALQRGIVADIIGGFSVRDLPDDIAAVQIDGRDAAIRRFQERHAFDGQTGGQSPLPAAFRRHGERGSAHGPARARRHSRQCPGRTPYRKYLGRGRHEPKIAMAVCENKYMVCVSGSYDPPGQFAPPVAPGETIVPSGPPILLTEGGVNIGPIAILLDHPLGFGVKFRREVDQVVDGNALVVVSGWFGRKRLRGRIPLSWHIALRYGCSRRSARWARRSRD